MMDTLLQGLAYLLVFFAGMYVGSDSTRGW